MLHKLANLKGVISAASRQWRAELFYRTLRPKHDDAIVDLGGGRGEHFATYFPLLKNVEIADYNPAALDYAASVHGFKTRLVDGTERLPFADGAFDIVFCSSVIEHVTGPKDEAVKRFKENGRVFREQAWQYQREFAAEICRVGRRYFVQTPCRYFPVEVHSWIPLLGYLPTHVQWKIIRLFNRFWPRKEDNPDWALLSYRDMQRLFPRATIHRERFLLIFTKSLIAIQD
jgi:ubiquinone/menaquinone biosynthesis C-methylase UbiE